MNATKTRTPNHLRLAVAPLRGVEVRDATATGDGSWTIEGYAAVFEQETTLWDMPGFWRCREEVATGAFDDVLQRIGLGVGVVHLNHGHDMKTAMASSDVRGIGGLELSSDFHGLRYFARVDPDDPDVRAAGVKMRRGIVRQSSFAFTVAEETLVESRELDDGTWDALWRIDKVGELYDVCVCAQGAYAQTESAISERVAGLATEEARRAARSIRRARANYLGAAAAASVGRAGITVRTDVPSVALLSAAYEQIEEFVETDDDPDDVAVAEGILTTLDQLIVGEANEAAPDNDEDVDGGAAVENEMGRTPGGVGRAGRRSQRGRDRVASAVAGGTGGTDEQRLAEVKARANARTLTTQRRGNQ